VKVSELKELLNNMPDHYELQVEYDFDCDGQPETYYAEIEGVVQQPTDESTGIVYINIGKGC
jgi:hypothetical protein